MFHLIYLSLRITYKITFLYKVLAGFCKDERSTSSLSSLYSARSCEHFECAQLCN
jgi:hypothetical protein